MRNKELLSLFRDFTQAISEVAPLELHELRLYRFTRCDHRLLDALGWSLDPLPAELHEMARVVACLQAYSHDRVGVPGLDFGELVGMGIALVGEKEAMATLREIVLAEEPDVDAMTKVVRWGNELGVAPDWAKLLLDLSHWSDRDLVVQNSWELSYYSMFLPGPPLGRLIQEQAAWEENAHLYDWLTGEGGI